MSLDPQRVPQACRVLLPLAELWGVGDDEEREALVGAAGTDELRALVETVDAVPEADLYGWLAGPESWSEQPTREYIAVTCTTMAADSARHRLAQEQVPPAEARLRKAARTSAARRYRSASPRDDPGRRTESCSSPGCASASVGTSPSDSAGERPASSRHC